MDGGRWRRSSFGLRAAGEAKQKQKIDRFWAGKSPAQILLLSRHINSSVWRGVSTSTWFLLAAVYGVIRFHVAIGISTTPYYTVSYGRYQYNTNTPTPLVIHRQSASTHRPWRTAIAVATTISTIGCYPPSTPNNCYCTAVLALVPMMCNNYDNRRSQWYKWNPTPNF